MKNYLNAYRTYRTLFSLALAAGLALPLPALAASIALATSPLATSSTSSVKPNVMFMLDDSGSMDWDYMPDDSQHFSGKYGFNSNQCNGVYYNPSITYTPPVTSTGTSYGDATFTSVLVDGYNSSSGTVDLDTDFTGGSGSGSSGYTSYTGHAFYFSYSGTQTSAVKKDFHNTSSAFYQECNSSIGSTSVYDGTNAVNTVFHRTTLATTETATITINSSTASGTFTITVSGSSSTPVSSITVGGTTITSGASTGSSTDSTEASNLKSKITSNGFSATVSGSVITVTGPAAAGASVSITKSSGTDTFTVSAITPVAKVTGITVNGTQLILAGYAALSSTSSTTAANIASVISAVGYTATSSGNVVKITGPTSVAGYSPVLTYTGTMSYSTDQFPDTTPAHLTNFANWYSYYSNRMLMMKTGVGLAFQPLNDQYRVGYMTMNNNNWNGTVGDPSADFVNVSPFDATQKSAWYSKLYAANPGNSTPLREALSHVGQLYAHKFGPSTVYTSTITIGSSGSTTVSSITVNGTELLAGTSNSDTSTSRVARNVASKFIDPSDYTAAASSNKITITGPASASGAVPVITSSGGMTFSATVFSPKTVTANLNGVSPDDPVQYSCQQNFVILSTDGYWNGSTTYDLSTPTKTVGNQDGAEPRPRFDGAKADKITSQVYETVKQTAQTTTQLQQTQSKATQLQSSTTRLQSTTHQLQVQTAPLEKATSSNSGSTWSAWTAVASCKWDTSSSSRTKCQYGTLTAWSNTASCTANKQTGTSGGTTWTGDETNCQYAASAPVNVSTCTTVAQDTTSPYTVGTATICSYSAPVVANVSTCTTVAQDTTSPYDMSASGGVATTCSYTSGSWINVNTGACMPVAQDTTNPYDMSASGGVATACQTIGTASCASGTTCATVTTGPTVVASCTTASATSGNNWTATACTTSVTTAKHLVASCACTTTPTCSVTGGAPSYATTTCDTTSTTASGVSSCTPQVASPSNSYTTVTCVGGAGGTSDTLADVAMYYYKTDLRDNATLGNCAGATSTDFPSGNPDVCTNNVYVTGGDLNTNQHLTTFTLGLGTRGRMVYSSKDYMNETPTTCAANGTPCDFHSIATDNTLADSTVSPPICSWQSNGTVCNWPVPSSGSINNIDDLWHAAVDGHGTYFSATNPTELSDGLGSALSSITARRGSAAAAATSTLNPVAGNNYAYVASYTTVKWIGNLEARSINVTNGTISEAASWCVENLTAGSCSAPSTLVVDTSGASTVYNCVTPSSTSASCASPGVFDSLASTCTKQMAVACSGTMPTLVSASSDTRNIYTANSAGNALISFGSGTDPVANALYAATYSTNFDAAHISTLSQWATLSPAQQTAAAGANLVSFLRGEYGHEDRPGNLAADRLYRFREAVMGDALESEPAYLGPPTFNYTDPGYINFKSLKSSRPGTVYMGANDGMMHAFASDTGIERWAYVPSMVIPNLWQLADTGYDHKHANFVNGSAITSDVCVANCSDAATADWRTILVGGLDGGGRGYFALDITDPTAPALLWEFTTVQEPNVGYSFGHAVITKKLDGTWAVLVTSGYNNTSPGDGQGYLYVLNPLTGAEIEAIPTNVGSTTTPSGLSKIAAWNAEPSSNVADGVYGGDVLGNVWRFDINASPSASNPVKFATLKDPSGVAQPVTTTPVLGLVKGLYRVIFVGTGKYLEAGDLSDTQVQSMYAIKDDMTTITFANPRSHTTAPKMVNQTLAAVPSTGFRTTTSNTVDFSTDQGWYVDFPDAGERENIDSKLVQGTLLVPTIVPSSTVCSPGGYGWLNFFDYENGGPVPPTSSTGTWTDDVASVKYDSSIVGINIIYIGGDPIVEVVTSSDPTPRVDTNVSIADQGGNFTGRRMLWRELIP